MNDIIELLNIKQTDVQSYSVVSQENEVILELTLRKKHETCPRCNSLNYVVDGYKIKDISHPILNGINCIIKYHCRRYRCKECGKTFNETNTFVGFNKTYSKYSHQRVLSLLHDPHLTFTSVAKQCNLPIGTVVSIFDSLGIAKRLPLPKVLCIDEYYDPSAGPGKYNCVFMDFKTGQLIDVIPDRSKYYISSYFQSFKKSELMNVKHVSIDMWEPYRDIAFLYMHNAIISVDPFHVVKHVHDALTKVRVRIMKQFLKTSNNYYLLKKFSYLLDKNYSDLNYYEPKFNRKLAMFLNAHSTLNLILKINSELTLAYELKEEYYRFNKYSSYENAREYLDNFILKCKKTYMTEFVELAKTLNHWKEEIINSFIRIDGRRITNGPMESKNSQIKLVKHNANGYTNFVRERNRLFYCFNKNVAFIQLENNLSIKKICKPRKSFR